MTGHGSRRLGAVVTGALEEAGRRLALAFSNAVGGRIRALVDYEAINVAIRKVRGS